MARRLTYTFDNGPWPGTTERLLDFLAEREIKATFFVVGERLQDPESRRLTERAWQEGHWIGNHTLTHTTPLGRDGDRARVEREIGETEKLLGDMAHPRKFFRPNGSGSLGSHILSPDARDFLVENKYTMVTWNSVPQDWIDPHRDWLDRAKQDLETLDWPLLVLHDKFIGDMVDTLTQFHDHLLDQGVEVTQDFDPTYLPIDQGVTRPDLADLVSA
ncbi:polysaccharide deacetylase family protein [Hwanghaeella sp. LZ110]|jgi:peptidoglycan/xylan/chitin deacetylase (PgdA/CDA1 family)|uniref:polysaccharide deacetylase family protein n=1 Tax=Hwanghaeella sp. LZ110 TaxID=3402810 RepID=UPI003B6813BD